jgi:hypothetical protein
VDHCEVRIELERLAADLLDLDTALDELAALDERQARLVELRYFGGLTIEETAAVLGVSVPTANREWATAKMWLYRRLKHEKISSARSSTIPSVPEPRALRSNAEVEAHEARVRLQPVLRRPGETFPDQAPVVFVRIPLATQSLMDGRVIHDVRHPGSVPV